jgi:4a-hydroxytetrahydrobiopterin dehydratase
MPSRENLSDANVEQALQNLPDWERQGDAISKQYILDSFMDALALVNKVGEAAEAVDHHPDITINYRRVTFALSTHDRGGITQFDIDLAGEIEKIAWSPSP